MRRSLLLTIFLIGCSVEFSHDRPEVPFCVDTNSVESISIVEECFEESVIDCPHENNLPNYTCVASEIRQCLSELNVNPSDWTIPDECYDESSHVEKCFLNAWSTCNKDGFITNQCLGSLLWTCVFEWNQLNLRFVEIKTYE